MDKGVVHTYGGLLLSLTNNEIMPFATTWMDTEIVIQSKSARERHHMISLVESKIIIQNELIYKTEPDP